MPIDWTKVKQAIADDPNFDMMEWTHCIAAAIVSVEPGMSIRTMRTGTVGAPGTDYDGMHIRDVAASLVTGKHTDDMNMDDLPPVFAFQRWPEIYQYEGLSEILHNEVTELDVARHRVWTQENDRYHCPLTAIRVINHFYGDAEHQGTDLI